MHQTNNPAGGLCEKSAESAVIAPEHCRSLRIADPGAPRGLLRRKKSNQANIAVLFQKRRDELANLTAEQIAQQEKQRAESEARQKLEQQAREAEVYKP